MASFLQNLPQGKTTFLPNMPNDILITIAMKEYTSPVVSFCKDFCKKRCFFAAATLLVICAGCAGYFLGKYVQDERYVDFVKSFRNIRENSDKYTFINPLIGGISAPATDVGLFTDAKSKIEEYLKDQEYQKNLYDYSFYYRDLNTGLWFGLNESAEFMPASLFKLPIAIATYKKIEDSPAFENMTLLYTQEIASRNALIQLNAKSTLVIGNFYSVKELVNRMLTDSDNGAKDLLLSVLDINYIDQLFSIVNMVDPRSTQTYQISSRKYAHFLRVLYGSSYLNEEHSELILSMLSKSSFKDGLVAGVPKDMLVAHKFGAYEVNETREGVNVVSQQLHDCGVVYHEERPYIFCFMTKGKDLSTLYKIISHVSKIVHDEQEKDI